MRANIYLLACRFMRTEYAGSVEAKDPDCLRPGEAAVLLQGHPWRRFVALGDSVALGIGDPVDGYSPLSWVDRIAAELRESAPNFAYLNLGEKDARANEVCQRQMAAALAFRPDLALVAAGGRDAIRSSYRPDAVDEELRGMFTQFRQRGSDVITVGMFNVMYGPAIPDGVKAAVGERMDQLARRTAALAVEVGAIHVKLTGHRREQDPAMYSADGLHGNLHCHAICAAETIRRLGSFVGN
jgi:lysophospholipase L1-like esterase